MFARRSKRTGTNCSVMRPSKAKVRPPEAGVVHVWHARLSALAEVVPALVNHLSETEKERAGRFVRSADRTRYEASRGMLRCILGRYLNVDPGAVAFEYSPHGKPGLAGDLNESRLRFNLAHSGDVVALAVAKGLSVGIDVEQVRADFDFLELAESRFAEAEVVELKNLPAKEQPGAFFRCWTRKEAYLKARGEGLDLELDKFAVTFADGQAPVLRWVDDEPDGSAGWSFFELELCAGYAAALVVERPVSGVVPSISIETYVHG
jgi:4'-phosphopantetheinyl transferase